MIHTAKLRRLVGREVSVLTCGRQAVVWTMHISGRLRLEGDSWYTVQTDGGRMSFSADNVSEINTSESGASFIIL